MRIGEHARTHQLSSVALILHGGEPLLAGGELIAELVCATEAAVGPGVQVDAGYRPTASALMILTCDCSAILVSRWE